ncbi:hypothetical protein FGRA07_02499 [Fusarium graminearum]|nr:hypothetical protein HG531_001359 [Fusarium graminearum]PCD27360.1 hypothetical protein FGRA07_02499 [Fusarium graminearum]
MSSTTTAGAAATLAMQAKFGQILCSAPTHVAVDDFANRLDQITRSIAEEYNKGKKADDPSRLRHRFMLRVFTSNNELRALRALLEKPDAIDAAVNRADLYSVWGNTLLPCFLFGHPLHPPDITPNYQGGPTFMTTNEKDGNGNFLNRFAADGGVSPLAFFVATGIPVYRLKTQP